jgi:hypothetical protein
LRDIDVIAGEAVESGERCSHGYPVLKFKVSETATEAFGSEILPIGERC